jgi:hypothetical protein
MESHGVDGSILNFGAGKGEFAGNTGSKREGTIEWCGYSGTARGSTDMRNLASAGFE